MRLAIACGLIALIWAGLGCSQAQNGSRRSSAPVRTAEVVGTVSSALTAGPYAWLANSQGAPAGMEFAETATGIHLRGYGHSPAPMAIADTAFSYPQNSFAYECSADDSYGNLCYYTSNPATNIPSMGDVSMTDSELTQVPLIAGLHGVSGHVQFVFAQPKTDICPLGCAGPISFYVCDILPPQGGPDSGWDHPYVFTNPTTSNANAKYWVVAHDTYYRVSVSMVPPYRPAAT